MVIRQELGQDPPGRLGRLSVIQQDNALLPAPARSPARSPHPTADPGYHGPGAVATPAAPHQVESNARHEVPAVVGVLELLGDELEDLLDVGAVGHRNLDVRHLPLGGERAALLARHGALDALDGRLRHSAAASVLAGRPWRRLRRRGRLRRTQIDLVGDEDEREVAGPETAGRDEPLVDGLRDAEARRRLDRVDEQVGVNVDGVPRLEDHRLDVLPGGVDDLFTFYQQ